MENEEPSDKVKLKLLEEHFKKTARILKNIRETIELFYKGELMECTECGGLRRK